MPTPARLVRVEEKLRRLFPSKGHWRAVASIDSKSSRRCWAARRGGYARLRASKSIRDRSESPSRSMASGEERPGEQFGFPLHPAIAPCGRVGGGLAPPVSVRFRERGASGVVRLPRPQDLESAGSTKVVTCAAFALQPPSDFLPPRPRRNSEGVVIPFLTPMLARHRFQLNKVCSSSATNA